MEGWASVITGAHLFERGSPRQTAGRSFRAWFSLERAAELRYWTSEDSKAANQPPMGTVRTSNISGVRVVPPRRAGAGGERQLQFELQRPEGQRMVRVVPEDAAACEDWSAALTAVTGGRASAATSIAGAGNLRAAEGYREAVVEKEGLLWTPYYGTASADEPPWLAVRVRLERRGGPNGDASYVLRYGTAEADYLEATGGGAVGGAEQAADSGGRSGGLVNAEAIGMETVHHVQFGFGGAGSKEAALQTDRAHERGGPNEPGAGAVGDRKSCHLQFSISDAALDGLRLREQAAAEEGDPSRRIRVAPPGERCLRLRTRTTRDCIEWVHLLRKLSVDRLLYPELLPTGVQRLLRALYRRCFANADGTVREAELGRQLQDDRVLSQILPEEYRAAHAVGLDVPGGDPTVEAVEAAAAAAWVLEGEDAAHAVLADAVMAAQSSADGEVAGMESTLLGGIHQRSMTLDTFVHEMNSRHHGTLEAAAETYEVYTEGEALERLRQDYGLPNEEPSSGMSMSPVEVIWVVEERLGLPHEQNPHAMRAAAARAAGEAVLPPPVGMMGLPDQQEVIDEALVLLFAQVGVHIVLVPEEDASSKHAAMEGLARVVNDNAGSDESMRSTDNATGALDQQQHRSPPGGPRLLVDYGTLQLAESPDGWMGNRDTRPYGSYRRSRRLPTTEVVRREQRKAVMKDKPWILGESPSASLQARLAMSNVSLTRYQGASQSKRCITEAEEIQLALTPTVEDREQHSYLSHDRQKERRRKEFDEMMQTAASMEEDANATGQHSTEHGGMIPCTRGASAGSSPGAREREEARRAAQAKSQAARRSMEDALSGKGISSEPPRIGYGGGAGGAGASIGVPSVSVGGSATDSIKAYLKSIGLE